MSVAEHEIESLYRHDGLQLRAVGLVVRIQICGRLLLFFHWLVTERAHFQNLTR